MSAPVCAWCQRVALDDVRARFCSRRCRQAAWRIRRAAALADASLVPRGRFAYADPPYPGLAKRYYGREASYGGEVDHRALIASLEASRYAGWALSTSSGALRDVLPLCPVGARVCAWVKPIGAAARTRGIHSTWEPVIVVGGRQRSPGVRDWLRAMPARGGGEVLMGRKPLQFCAWLFDLLGMAPGDELVDVFPGTGVVGRAWAELSRGASADVSPGASADVSPGAHADVSPGAHPDASPPGAGDASFGADGDASLTPRGGRVAGVLPRRWLPSVAGAVGESSPAAAPDASLGPRGGRVGDPSPGAALRRIDAAPSSGAPTDARRSA